MTRKKRKAKKLRLATKCDSSGTQRRELTIEEALDRFSKEPIPNYSGFQDWFASELKKEEAEVRDPSDTYASMSLLKKAMVHLQGISHQLREEKRPSFQYRSYSKLKLLSSLFSASERGQELVKALIEKDPKVYELNEDLDDLNQTQLRANIFRAINQRHSEVAFKILGKLRKTAHDVHEIDYLEGLCYFKSEKLTEAIKYLKKVKPKDRDYVNAFRYRIEIHGLLGEWKHAAEQLAILVTSFKLSDSMLAYLYGVIVKNSADPVGAAEFLNTQAVRLNHLGVFRASDSGYKLMIMDRTRNLIELTERLFSIRDAQLSKEQSGDVSVVYISFTREWLESVVSEDLRLRQLCVAVGSAEYLLREIASGNHVSYITEPLRQFLITQFDPDIWGLHFEALFRLNAYEKFKKSFDQYWFARKSKVIEKCEDIHLLAYQVYLSRSDPLALEIAAEIDGSTKGVAIPGIAQEANDRALIATLSPMGRQSFTVSLRQFQWMSRTDPLWKDAGILSLGFFRIIELELNERIIKPLLKRVSGESLEEAFTVNGLDGPPSWHKKWAAFRGAYIALSDKKKSGIELGPLNLFLGAMKRPSDEEEKVVRALLWNGLQPLLTEAGINAIKNGDFAKSIETAVIEAYRNPPAHSRFVTFKRAEECLSYVRKILNDYSDWIKL